MQVNRLFLPISLFGGAAALTLALAFPAIAQQPTAPTQGGGAGDLPSASGNGGVTQVFVSGGTRSLFKIAVTPPPGDQSVATEVVDTASHDFTLSSMFQVLDPKGFTANLEKEGLSIDPASWRNIGA